MKPVIVLAVIIASGFAAPIDEAEELLRTKKSFGPIALHLAPPPHFRQVEFLDDHHARSNYESALGGLVAGASSGGYGGASAGSALAGYGGVSGGSASSGCSSASHALAGGLSSAVASGQAVGLFPNAHVGGCNVPLLLSCAPSVVAGHLAESHGYSAPAYRNTEDMEWEQLARSASHHKVSEDFPASRPAAPVGHFVVSHDYPAPNLTHVASQPQPEKV